MKTGVFTLSKGFGLGLAAASLLAGGPAMAQQAGHSAQQSDPPQEQVTVQGQMIVRNHKGSSAQLEAGGFGHDVLTLSHQVSYSDLDLASPADVVELRERVGDAAKQICERLNDMAPPEPSTSSQCMHVAVKGAMKQVHAAVAAARD